MRNSRKELLSGVCWLRGLQVLLVLASLSGSLPLLATTSVTLYSATSPTSGDAGVSNISVTGHGFPSGTIPPANVTVTLSSTVTGAPTATTTASSVTVVSGSTERVIFKIPSSLAVPAATPYKVSIAGTTSTGNAFQSANTSALTVNASLVITTTSPLPTGTVGQSYSQTLAATGGSGGYVWSVKMGSLPAGLTLNTATGQISGQPTAAGVSDFEILVTDSDGHPAGKVFALTIDPALVITTSSPLPLGTVGVSYSQTLAATGGSGSYTWSVSAGALPGGLSLTTATGLISGVPTGAGAASFTIQVTDSTSAIAVKAFTLTIDAPLVITTSSPLPMGTVGVNYSQTLAATGGSGSYTWSVSAGTLPAGLSLATATGVISGQPTTSGAFSFTIKVTDTTSATATKAFALTVNPVLLITTTSPLPTGQVGVNYSQTLTATGGSGSYTWSVSAGTLPAGLSLTPATGLISGQPTTSGTANFTIQVTDTDSVTATQSFALTINPAPTILTLSPNAANAGLALQVSITGSYTNFVQGTTTANFGAGIAVGGGVAGQPGPVTVTSPTTATAQISITASAATGSQTVTVITGSQQVSLANGFTIEASIPYVTIDTTSPTTIPTGFSGFNDSNLITGVEYTDPKYEAMVLPLKPGFIRYPGGLDSMAFEWQTAHENKTWISELTPDLNTTELGGLNKGSALGQAKGGVCFTTTPPGTCYSDFSQLTAYVGANALVCFNGFTDTDPNSAGLMVTAAQNAGLNVIEWELANEPYGYPLIYPTPASYATAQYNPYYQDIAATQPSATVGLFYQGKFSSFNGAGYPAWDSGMNAYTPQYWNAVSTHIYPITSSTLTTAQEEAQLNSVLGYASTAYISSYLAPLVGLNTPIFITEFDSDAYATLNFETYLYNGIFLAEYIARMSTLPYVKGVAVQGLYLGNTFQQGIIRAVNDYESYLIGQVQSNPSYSTNTATNPNTQFQFYYSTSGLALQVANLAINSSNAIWPTTVNGTVPTVPTSPVQGYGGQPIPAVFAQGYQGINGTHYLFITNKSNQSLPFAIEVNGSLLEQSVTVTYVSNASDTAANTATNQTNVQVMTTTSANPITVGPYSVTTVQW